ncbi:uncharacterized protein LOC142796487 [Rhipicephalus microplus]|uniref:uncharacterized protein LOC142796487 n=1 Tax=Rhipicephalus microplus TaxID=6941 RepID=UPI003F6A7B68
MRCADPGISSSAKVLQRFIKGNGMGDARDDARNRSSRHRGAARTCRGLAASSLKRRNRHSRARARYRWPRTNPALRAQTKHSGHVGPAAAYKPDPRQLREQHRRTSFH